MLKVILSIGQKFLAYFIDEFLEPVLVITNRQYQYGRFKAVSRISTGTSTVIECGIGESLIITDICLSSEKYNGGKIYLRFSDGTNIVDIYSSDITDSPLNIIGNFSGKIKGYKDASIILTTTNNFYCGCTVGYIRIKAKKTVTYSQWNEEL
jgi:hypothetical protein